MKWVGTVKPLGFFRPFMEDMKLLLAIWKTGYQNGLPDEEHISKFKEQMKQEDYIRISPELAAQAQAKAKALGSETEKGAEIFHSIDSKLSCFLEAIDSHHLSHLLKGQKGNR